MGVYALVGLVSVGSPVSCAVEVQALVGRVSVEVQALVGRVSVEVQALVGRVSVEVQALVGRVSVGSPVSWAELWTSRQPCPPAGHTALHQ